MKIKFSVLESMLTLWVSIVLVMPLIPLHKVIFSSIFIFYAISHFLNKKREFNINTISPFLLTMIFFYGLFVSSFDDFDADVTIQLLSSLAVLYLFYIVYQAKVDFNKILLRSVYLFSVVSLTLGLEGYFFDGGIVTNIVAPYNLLSLDERDIGFGDVLYSRLISLPIVFVSFAQLMFNAKFNGKVNYLGMFLFSVVIVISLTRALIFCWFLLIIFSMLFRSSIFKKVTSMLLLTFSVFWVANSGTFSTQEQSNKTKLEDVTNFIEHVNKNDSVLLVGDGIGSYFYRYGKGEYAKTENTLLDFVRYFGFPLAILVYILLFYPFKFNFNERIAFLFASFFLYTLMSLSNPTLFNSFGCIAIIWYWYNLTIEKRLCSEENRV